MNYITIDDKIIQIPILDILLKLRQACHFTKLSQITQRSDNIRVTCPFHKGGEERRASSDIYIGPTTEHLHTGHFHCFTCGKNVPFEFFVAACLSSSIEYAKDWLVTTFSDHLVTIDSIIDLPVLSLDNSSKIRKLPECILDNFTSFHPYMTSRKISKDIIELFQIKYDPNTQTIIFPVRDLAGNLISLAKRKINSKFFILDDGVEKPLYLLDFVVKNNLKSIVITEGPFDALTAYTYGMPAVATFGSISNSQIKQLNRSGIRVCYAMFDNDTAGKMFLQKLKNEISSDILLVPVDISRVCNKKDINDLSKDEFLNCINIAKNTTEFLVY